MEKLGIDQLEKLVRAAAQIGSTAGIIFEDHKITLGDVDDMWAASGAVADLFTLNFDLVVPQLKDLDKDEAAYLCSVLVEEFDIPQDGIEKRLEGYLQRGRQLYCLFRELVAFHTESYKEGA